MRATPRNSARSEFADHASVVGVVQRLLRKAVLLCLMLTVTLGISAGEVTLLNRPPNTSDLAQALISDRDSFAAPPIRQQVADSFSLQSPSVITGVTWWGFYFRSFGSAPISPPQGAQFHVRIFADNGRVPSLTPIYERTLLATVSPFSFVQGWPTYQFNMPLTVPFEVRSQTDYYWLSVVEDDTRTSAGGPFSWFNSHPQGGSIGVGLRGDDANLWGNTENPSQQMSFSLTGTAGSLSALRWYFTPTNYTVLATQSVVITALITNSSDAPITISDGGSSFAGNLQHTYSWQGLLDLLGKVVPAHGTINVVFGRLTPIDGFVEPGVYFADPAGINFDQTAFTGSDNTFRVVVTNSPPVASIELLSWQRFLGRAAVAIARSSTDSAQVIFRSVAFDEAPALLTHTWVNAETGVALGVGETITNSLPAGRTTVGLIVSDGESATTNYVGVEVITLPAALEELSSAIATSTLSRQKRQMLALLRAAARAAQRGNFGGVVRRVRLVQRRLQNQPVPAFAERMEFLIAAQMIVDAAKK